MLSCSHYTRASVFIFNSSPHLSNVFRPRFSFVYQYSMKGLAILLIDYLASAKVDGYADEVTIASDLRLSQKNVRKALRYLEAERLVAAETVKFAFRHRNAEQIDDEEVEERKRRETHVFWCLDYPRLVDSFRLRLFKVKDVLKKQIEGADAVQQYICPRCGAKFSSLDAISLLDPMTGVFRCEECKGELTEHVEGPSQTGGGATAGTAGAASRRERQAFFKDLSSRIEQQLKPLVEQLEKVRDVTPPDYGPLQDWYEVRREEAAKRAKRLEAARRKVAEAGGAAAAELTDEQLLEWAERAEVVVALPGQEIIGGAAAAAAAVGPGKELPAWFRMVDEGGASVNAGAAAGVGEEVAGRATAGEVSEEQKRQLEQQYLEQYLTQVRQAQATMASAGVPAAAEGDEKGSKRLKMEQGGVKAEEEEAMKQEPVPTTAANGGAGGAKKKEEEGEEIAWEDDEDGGLDWEDA